MSASVRLYKQSNRLPRQQPLPWPVFIRNILGKDVVLWIALALAVVSSLAVRPPVAAYAEAIDFKTLACLGSLMTASGGFMLAGLFDLAAAHLVDRCRSSHALLTAMILATFLSSMFITNDVALIVLVPMTLAACKRTGGDPLPAVVLQTVAANVGSILMPMGNPQNLYLYSRYDMAFIPFLKTVLPLSLAGLVLLLIFCLLAKREAINCPIAEEIRVRWREAALCAALFTVAALAVFDVLDYRPVFAAAVAVTAIKGRGMAQQIDYALLLTFVGFFVFVGNIAHTAWLGDWLAAFVGPNPFLASVASSQVISNVPAAVLASRFTDDGYAVLAGVSAGGCGTLIASMASFISDKLYVSACNSRKRFLVYFTAVNLLFLAAMMAAHFLWQFIENAPPGL